MENFYLSFSVVFPLFFMLSLGYFLKSIKMFDTEFSNKLNSVCFKVFLPILLFVNIYNSTPNLQSYFKLIIYGMSAITIAFILLMFLIPKIVKNNYDVGVVIQGIFRGNFILFGIPVTASLYGSDNTGTTVVLIAFVVPLINVLSVIALQSFSDKKPDIKKIAIGVLKNPIVIASIIGFAFLLSGIKFPSYIESSLTSVSAITTPLSLIVLGSSFQFANLTKYLKLLIFSIIGKLVIMPMIFLPIALLLGFKGYDICALMAMLASPTAVSSYTMAQQADANDELAGQIVVIDSMCSIVTIFIWITILSPYLFAF